MLQRLRVFPLWLTSKYDGVTIAVAQFYRFTHRMLYLLNYLLWPVAAGAAHRAKFSEGVVMPKHQFADRRV
jgi:hypothetical protein